MDPWSLAGSLLREFEAREEGRLELMGGLRYIESGTEKSSFSYISIIICHDYITDWWFGTFGLFFHILGMS